MWLASPGRASVSLSARAYPSTEMRCATAAISRSIERSGGLDAPCAQGHPTSIAAPIAPSDPEPECRVPPSFSANVLRLETTQPSPGPLSPPRKGNHDDARPPEAKHPP